MWEVPALEKYVPVDRYTSKKNTERPKLRFDGFRLWSPTDVWELASGKVLRVGGRGQNSSAAAAALGTKERTDSFGKSQSAHRIIIDMF